MIAILTVTPANLSIPNLLAAKIVRRCRIRRA